MEYIPSIFNKEIINDKSQRKAFIYRAIANVLIFTTALAWVRCNDYFPDRKREYEGIENKIENNKENIR